MYVIDIALNSMFSICSKIFVFSVSLPNYVPIPQIISDRCYYFQKYIAEKFGEKIGVFDSNKRQFCRKSDHNIGF
jgi:hypothetical protein